MPIVHLTGNEFVGIVALITSGLVTVLIGFMIHRSNESEAIKFSLPKLPVFIPFTTAARIRRAKAEVRLAEIEADLYEAKHNKLQKELIYTDLDNERYKRALGSGE